MEEVSLLRLEEGNVESDTRCHKVVVTIGGIMGIFVFIFIALMVIFLFLLFIWLDES